MSSSKTPGRRAVALAAPNPQARTATQTSLASKGNRTLQLSSRSGRERRPSDRVLAQICEEEEAATRKEEQARRRTERERTKAQQIQDATGDIPDNVDDEREERHTGMFTSHTVPSKPSNLARRTNKVPQSTAPTADAQVTRGNAANDSDSDSQDENEALGHHNHTPFQDPQSQLEYRSHSPSIQPHEKRPRSRSNDSDLETEEVVRKAQKINEKSGRPKAGDYDDVAKEIILQAATIYRCLLSTDNGFPELAVETQFVKSAWEDANKESGMSTLALTPEIAKIIKARGSQARGEAKDKTKSFVETMYGFESGHSQKVITANRKLAEELKREKGFIYETMPLDGVGSRKGMYSHPIIQKAVNVMWFQNKRDEGLLFMEMFKPIPIPAIAFVLTAIEANIDEWLTGEKTSVTFWSDEYRSTYKGHIEALEAYGHHTKKFDLIGRLQRRLFNYGRHHAGVPPTELNNLPIIPASAYAAALKEYEDMDETDSEGDGLGWY